MGIRYLSSKYCVCSGYHGAFFIGINEIHVATFSLPWTFVKRGTSKNVWFVWSGPLSVYWSILANRRVSLLYGGSGASRAYLTGHLA